MADGVVAHLDELIDLRRYAQKLNSSVQGRALSAGNRLSKIRGRGMDFAEARHYQPGDEVRHMEWRVTARTGKPHVKIYQEERERPVVLIVDFNPSMIFGTRIAFKSVVAARLAALIAWTTSQLGDKVGGLFFSATEHSEFLPRSRDMGVLPLLASLSHYSNQTEAQKNEEPRVLSDALKRSRRVVRPGSIIVLISDFYSLDANCEKHLTHLGQHNDILAYHVCDPIELNAPKPQQYPMTNGRQELLLDTSHKAVSTAYQTYCQNRIHHLQRQFKSLQIAYQQVTADAPLNKLVQHTFSGRTRG